jgi:hypothetical protein
MMIAMMSRDLGLEAVLWVFIGIALRLLMNRWYEAFFAKATREPPRGRSQPGPALPLVTSVAVFPTTRDTTAPRT